MYMPSRRLRPACTRNSRLRRARCTCGERWPGGRTTDPGDIGATRPGSVLSAGLDRSNQRGRLDPHVLGQVVDVDDQGWVHGEPEAQRVRVRQRRRAQRRILTNLDQRMQGADRHCSLYAYPMSRTWHIRHAERERPGMSQHLLCELPKLWNARELVHDRVDVLRVVALLANCRRSANLPQALWRSGRPEGQIDEKERVAVTGFGPAS